MLITSSSLISKCKKTIGIITLSGVFILSGCSSIPKSIEGNNSPILQKNFTSVHNSPNLYQGQQVRFGGTVVNVINRDNATLLEIAVLPLDSSAKPEINQPYQGRIIAKSDKFLDPVNFRNHLVTVLGTLTGSQKGTIGKTPYNFVTMNIEGYQVWHLTETIQPIAEWDYGFGPYWQAGQWNNGFGPDWGWYAADEGQVLTTVTQ